MGPSSNFTIINGNKAFSLKRKIDILRKQNRKKKLKVREYTKYKFLRQINIFIFKKGI